MANRHTTTIFPRSSPHSRYGWAHFRLEHAFRLLGIVGALALLGFGSNVLRAQTIGPDAPHRMWIARSESQSRVGEESAESQSRIPYVRPIGTLRGQAVRARNPTLAFALSGFGLLIPSTVGYYRLTDGTADLDGATFAILAGGIIIGPALGHFYAGSSDRGWSGISLRLVSGLVTIGATFGTIVIGLSGANPIVGVLIMAAGAIVAGTSAVYDVVRAPASAQEWNDRHELTVRPVFNPHTSSFGAAVGLTF